MPIALLIATGAVLLLAVCLPYLVLRAAMLLVVSNPLNDRGVDFGDQSRGPNANGSSLRQPEGDLTKPNRVPRGSLVARIKEPTSYKLTATYSFGGGGGR